MNSILNFLSQLGKVFNALSPSKRVSIVAVALIAIVSIATFVVYINKQEYRTLYSNLSTEDAGAIASRLQEKKVPYRVSFSGDTISVPAEKVSELRFEMAESGLPMGGGVGFEIFDQKSFGDTEFVQHLNYQRALQGELSRTINDLDEIQQSRVHIVIPRQSLFIEEQVKPTASVVLKLKAGMRLRAPQIEGIGRLVASSVEGLDPEEVMIVDGGGNILSTAKHGSQLSKQTDSQIEFQRNLENNLATRIQSMLEKVVGKDKIVARVSASLDFKVTEKTEETYDPEEPVVRSVHRKSETGRSAVSSGESTVSPISAQSGGMTGPAGHEKTDETVNYEINRVVSKTVMPVGEMKNLSVAVLVDGIYSKNDQNVEEFRPRSKKELAILEGLVKRSVGFDVQRGDQIVVSSIPFKKIEFETDTGEKVGFIDRITQPFMVARFIKYAVSLIALLLVVFFVLRPLIGFILSRDSGANAVNSLPDGSRGQLEGGGVTLALEGSAKNPALKGLETVKTMAGQDARKFAEVLENWL
jgi:flagellar M-ring protein FliF